MTQASTHELQSLIDLAWEGRASINATNSPEIYQAVERVVDDLNAGRLRVAERQGVGQWSVNQWVKKAVLLSFRLNDNKVVRAGDLGFFDKVQTKFAHLDEEQMRATGVRVVPPAVARRGSYIAKNVVLMPSFVNIGAYVDEGTMVVLDFLDGALNAFLRSGLVILDRIGESIRCDFKGHRNRAHRRQDLRLADKQRRASAVRRAVRFNGCQAANGADFAIGVNVFAVNTGRVHRQRTFPPSMPSTGKKFPVNLTHKLPLRRWIITS